MWQYRSRHCTLTPPSLIPSPLCSLGLTSLNQPRLSGLHCWGRGICSGQDSSPISKQCPSQVERKTLHILPLPEGSSWGSLCLETIVRSGWATQGFLVAVLTLCVLPALSPGWTGEVRLLENEEEIVMMRAYCTQGTSPAVQSPGNQKRWIILASSFHW